LSRFVILEQRNAVENFENASRGTQIPAPEQRNEYRERDAPRYESGSPEPELIGVFERQGHGVEKIPCSDGYRPSLVADEKHYGEARDQDRVFSPCIEGSFGFCPQERKFAEKLRYKAAGAGPPAERASE
jgi:hypothetical protein